MTRGERDALMAACDAYLESARLIAQELGEEPRDDLIVDSGDLALRLMWHRSRSELRCQAGNRLLAAVLDALAAR